MALTKEENDLLCLVENGAPVEFGQPLIKVDPGA